MNPVFAEWGGRTIYWYGLLFAGGFFVTILHWVIMARREGRPAGFGLELGLWFMISSVLGARAAFVIAHSSEFIADPLRIFRLDQGGLIYYGGMIGAVVGLMLFAWIRGISKSEMADFTILGVPLGHAVGRAGCFMNGCCYGAPTDLPWGVPLNGVFRHPVPLLETILNLCLYIILLKAYHRKHRHGRIFALYLMLYPTMRFFMEFLRGDVRMTGLVINVAQELSILFVILGALLWWILPRKRHHHEHVAR